MVIEKLFTLTDTLLERALDGLTQRQRATAQNIANVDTPGYKREHVPFEAVLRDAVARQKPTVPLQTTHPAHIPSHPPVEHVPAQFPVVTSRTTTMRNDGNNVDIEHERAQMMKDEVHYSAVAQQVDKRFAMLKDVIRQGGR